MIKNPDSFNKVKSEYNDIKTVPQIFITDENGNYIYHIPGSDKLIELEKAGKLDYMLNNGDDIADTNHHNIECEEYHNPSSDDLI